MKSTVFDLKFTLPIMLICTFLSAASQNIKIPDRLNHYFQKYFSKATDVTWGLCDTVYQNGCKVYYVVCNAEGTLNSRQLLHFDSVGRELGDVLNVIQGGLTNIPKPVKQKVDSLYPNTQDKIYWDRWSHPYAKDICDSDYVAVFYEEDIGVHIQVDSLGLHIFRLTLNPSKWSKIPDKMFPQSVYDYINKNKKKYYVSEVGWDFFYYGGLYYHVWLDKRKGKGHKGRNFDKSGKPTE